MKKSEQIAGLELAGKQIIVTGASGFIGSYIHKRLLALGATVTSTTRGVASLPNPGWVCVDLLEKDRFEELLIAHSADVVFHLGSPVNPSRDDSLTDTMERGIVHTTDNIARACLARGVRLVVAGTCEEYGDAKAPFNEVTAPKPVSPYSIAKAKMSRSIIRSCKEDGLRATVARPFLTYGPGQISSRLIPSAICAAVAGEPFNMTAGIQTREFNYISDIGDGIIACANEKAEGHIFNIGGGTEVSVIEVVRRIYKLCNADISLINPGALSTRRGEVDRFYGDHEKARNILGHSPKIGLDEGLKATIAWWRAR